MLKLSIEQLNRGANLEEGQIATAVEQLTDEQVPVEEKADFLTALHRKGETFEEIAGFARELRARAIVPPVDEAMRGEEIIDVCGTGGDGLNTFNISTTVAIIVAAGGVMVAKHGNRAITSRSGSADVLEALGVRIDLTPEEAVAALKRHRFAFFFAPHYHPAFKHIGPARKLCAERGQRTLFNFLGPVLNPVRPSAQLIGVASLELCEPLIRVLQLLGVRRGMVASGKAGDRCLDELSILGDTVLSEYSQNKGFHTWVLAPPRSPSRPAGIEDLAGGDREANAEIIRRLVSGEEKGPKRDAVLLNAAAALVVAGQADSIGTGWDMAARLIDEGKAADKLKEISSS